MIKRFTEYISKFGKSKESRGSRESIDDLEVLIPDQLGELLLSEVYKDSPDVQYIKDIIAVGCPIGARDNFGWTALHFAAQWGRLEIVKFLVSIGADMQARNNDDKTPWNVASYETKEYISKLNTNK